MPFDAMGRKAANLVVGRRLRVAVIGSGISGLSAAWLLSGRHEVVVYERDRRFGGHANTIDVPLPETTVAVDAGFIVFNRRNYPNLTALFETLGVAVETADMSFAASFCDGGVEYSGRSLSAIFADRKSIASPSHWAMLTDIVRFNCEAKSAMERGLDDSVSLGAFVRERKFSRAFVDRFLIPIAAAIWSTPSIKILDYPAASLFRFYANHGLLQISNIPQWNTVEGGSRIYVERMSERFKKKARLGVRVVSVERASGGVIVTDEKGAADRFDEVVIATHADRALAMLKNPTDRERTLLGAFAYQPNHAVAHFDRSQMPRRRRVWASWNYLGGDGAASVTYWMNLLQNIRSDRDIFVTLNPLTPVRGEDVIAEFEYDHPMFDIEAGRAQKELWSLQGVGGVWFCGAYFGSGFHEDGLQAGLAVAEDLGGVRRPWAVAGEAARIWRHAPSVAAAAE